MTSAHAVSWPRMIARALGLGVVVMIILPVVALLGVLALGHLSGGCGPGSSGGCEMGAAMVGLYAILPGFLLGIGVSLFRDLRGRRE